jgi:casein kinase I homolog HRR25
MPAAEMKSPMGTGKHGNCIYVTDLDLAAQYRPHRAPTGAPPSNPGLFGTTRFASVKGHLGVVSGSELTGLRKTANHEPEQSRRDDLESLGYMLLYFP